MTAVLLIACLALAAGDPEELYRRGLQLFREHQTAAAIAAYRQSLELRPGSAPVWKALGVAYAYGGDYAASEEPFHRACLLNPREPDACLYFGRALYLQDRFEEALGVLRTAEKNEPESTQVFRVEGLCLEALGKPDQAAAALRESMRLDRGSSANEDPAIDYGVFLYRQGRAEEALRPLLEAVRRHPQASRANLELGCVVLSLDRPGEAATYLERAVTLDPASARGHLLLGRAYLRLGKAEEGRRELDRAGKR